jgi:hypothetical protein
MVTVLKTFSNTARYCRLANTVVLELTAVIPDQARNDRSGNEYRSGFEPRLTAVGPTTGGTVVNQYYVPRLNAD